MGFLKSEPNRGRNESRTQIEQKNKVNLVNLYTLSLLLDTFQLTAQGDR